MPDMTWAPCEHENLADERMLTQPPWPRHSVCADCGRPVLVFEDGTITEEVRGL